jgi:hypothetical protein
MNAATFIDVLFQEGKIVSSPAIQMRPALDRERVYGLEAPDAGERELMEN